MLLPLSEEILGISYQPHARIPEAFADDKRYFQIPDGFREPDSGFALDMFERDLGPYPEKWLRKFEQQSAPG